MSLSPPSFGRAAKCAAAKLCTIKKADSKDDITTFINLYYENMKRVDAKKSYFFSEDYFYKFAHNDNCKIEILLASLNKVSFRLRASLISCSATEPASTERV